MIQRVFLVLPLLACNEGDPPSSNAGIDASPIEGVCMPGDGDDPYADCVESFVPGERRQPREGNPVDDAAGPWSAPAVFTGPPFRGPSGPRRG